MKLIQFSSLSETRPGWFCGSTFNIRNAGMVLLLTALLAGCGQRGPLYLPDEAPPGANTGQVASDVDPLEEELEEEDELEGGNLEDEDIDGI
jgi:predicted small lipoprotein YifL